MICRNQTIVWIKTLGECSKSVNGCKVHQRLDSPVSQCWAKRYWKTSNGIPFRLGHWKNYDLGQENDFFGEDVSSIRPLTFRWGSLRDGVLTLCISQVPPCVDWRAQTSIQTHHFEARRIGKICFVRSSVIEPLVVEKDRLIGHTWCCSCLQILWSCRWWNIHRTLYICAEWWVIQPYHCSRANDDVN